VGKGRLSDTFAVYAAYAGMVGREEGTIGQVVLDLRQKCGRLVLCVGWSKTPCYRSLGSNATTQ
jgi:hypothetical protein